MKPVQWWTTQPTQKTGRGPLKRILTGIWPFPQLPGRCSGLPRKARPRRGEAVTSLAPSTHLPHGLRLGAPGLSSAMRCRSQRIRSMPSLKQPGQTWNLPDQACLQRLWPVSTSGASSAVWGLGGLPQQVLPPPPLLPR